MADWNPSLYLQFGAERTRPAAELLARIAHHPATLAVDLGCGRQQYRSAARCTARCNDYRR